MNEIKQGHGHFEKCQSYNRVLINGLHHVRRHTHANHHIDRISNWYVLGGLVNMLDEPYFNFDPKSVILADFKHKVNDDFCRKNWEDIKNQSENVHYFYASCATGAYYYTLMTKGYGISPHKTLHRYNSKVDLGWSVGALLIHGQNKE